MTKIENQGLTEEQIEDFIETTQALIAEGSHLVVVMDAMTPEEKSIIRYMLDKRNWSKS